MGVRPEFLINKIFPHQTGTVYIDAYINDTAKGYVNTSWIQTDGSAGFGGPPMTSVFEYYIDKSGNGRRLRMPSTLSSDLLVELRGFKKHVTPAINFLPKQCN